MSALGFGLSALKNFQPTTSVLAGGAASIAIYGAGTLLVTAGIALPFIGIPTMAMVGVASVIGGHLITALVPDSTNQNLNALAAKGVAAIKDIQSDIPQIEYSFPGDVRPSASATNITTGN